MLRQLVVLHQHGVNHRAKRRLFFIILWIAIILTTSVLYLSITAFAAPAYLIMGYLLGSFAKGMRVLMRFRRGWFVYDAAIDWDRVESLLGEPVAEEGPISSIAGSMVEQEAGRLKQSFEES
jgi:hypothetical protein